MGSFWLATQSEIELGSTGLVGVSFCAASAPRSARTLFWSTKMNKPMLIALAAITGLGGNVFAACSGTQVTDSTGTKETATVTFPAVSNSGNPNPAHSVTVAGLTFTASGNKTAANVAAAFASLANNATSGSSNPATQYSGKLVGWTSAAASGSTVVFTSVNTGNVPNISLSAAGSGQASPTAVTTDGTTVTTLSTLLSGNTVCVGSSGNWEAQEFHAANGDLIDWKRGASHPVDPTKKVGTWSITGTGSAMRVNYTYGSQTYSNAVWNHGDGTYSFCNNQGTETIGRMKTGQGACP